MDNFYQQQISRTGAGEAWKQAPVAFESCWDMRKWKEAGWDIRHIFDYALQLRNANNAEPQKVVLVMEDSIRGWLPGTRKTEAAIQLPTSIQPGDYELAVGVVDLSCKTPAVRLAIAGRDAEGWYPVSHVEISSR